MDISDAFKQLGHNVTRAWSSILGDRRTSRDELLSLAAKGKELRQGGVEVVVLTANTDKSLTTDDLDLETMKLYPDRLARRLERERERRSTRGTAQVVLLGDVRPVNSHKDK